MTRKEIEEKFDSEFYLPVVQVESEVDGDVYEVCNIRQSIKDYIFSTILPEVLKEIVPEEIIINLQKLTGEYLRKFSTESARIYNFGQKDAYWYVKQNAKEKFGIYF